MQETRWRGITPLQRSSWCILQSQSTGQLLLVFFDVNLFILSIDVLSKLFGKIIDIGSTHIFLQDPSYDLEEINTTIR